MSTSATSSPVALSVSVEAHACYARSAHKVKLVLEHKLVADGFFGSRL
jgi:hypothetical protein